MKTLVMGLQQHEDVTLSPFDSKGRRLSKHELISRLIGSVGRYLPAEQADFVGFALEFADDAHRGQVRESKEPVIIHPIWTALLLANMRLPSDVIAAALLHDTVEDCDTTNEQIQDRFGSDVARMVDGVTKLSNIELQLESAPERNHKRRHTDQRERRRIHSLRKMLLTAGQDHRVLLIKLADRMHNMATLSSLKPEKRLRIADETMNIYAPIADRLGMYDFKWQLEDSAFRYLKPKDYQIVSRLVNRTRRDREAYIAKAEEILHLEVVERRKIDAIIKGRAKHLYSIYKKKQRYEQVGRTFHDIQDLFALRVITHSEQDCYNSLGIVHAMWPMVTGYFDDYISKPKANGYRSLHTTVLGPDKIPIEVQIRSREMDLYAENGAAAHWAYKEGDQNGGFSDYYSQATAWIQDLTNMDADTRDVEEFVQTVETETLRSEEVQVFTPAGDVVSMIRGATPLDFAYRIHTELGDNTVGALVNGKLVALNTALESGDIVEIREARVPRGPSLDWLDEEKRYLVTSSAKSKVRQWFRRQERETNMQVGRRQLKRVLDKLRRMGHEINAESVADMMGYSSVEEMVSDLGNTNEQPSSIVRTVARSMSESHAEVAEKAIDEQIAEGKRAAKRKAKKADPSRGIVVMGQTGMQVNFPKCCSPVYGDEIAGYLTRGRGVSAHRTGCRNLKNIKDLDRIVDVAWGHIDDTYPARLRVDASDRIGLIHDICGIIRAEKMNIHQILSGEDLEKGKTTVTLTVYAASTEQLAHLFLQVEEVPGVESVTRIS